MSEDVLNEPRDPSVVTSAMVRSTIFHVEAATTEASTVVRLQGELDMATAPRLRDVLQAALDESPSSLTVDLSELGFADSTGIGVLAAAARRAERDGCSLVVRSPCMAVLKVLRLTGVDQLLAIEAGPSIP